MYDTKFLCPTCGKRLKGEVYVKMPKSPKIEIFCEEGHFNSDCNIASKVLAECEATCDVSTIQVN